MVKLRHRWLENILNLYITYPCDILSCRYTSQIWGVSSIVLAVAKRERNLLACLDCYHYWLTGNLLLSKLIYVVHVVHLHNRTLMGTHRNFLQSAVCCVWDVLSAFDAEDFVSNFYH